MSLQKSKERPAIRKTRTGGRLMVTIVFPCRNEERTVGACVREGREALAAAGVSGEVLVVDNGSEDSSAAVARKAGARVVSCVTPGYGAALDHGVGRARGRYVLMLDADGSYDPTSLPEFLVRLQEGYALVIGNRFLGGIEEGAMPWKNRYLGNPVLSFLGRRMFGLQIGDFHCGIRAFRRDVIRRLGLQSLGMEYASEMIVRAGLAGLRIAEVPVILRKDRRGRSSHLRPWRDGWRHLRFLLLFSPRWLFLLPGSVLILVGLVLAGAGMGPWPIDFKEALVLLSSVALGAGYQFVLFGMLARVFGVENGFLPEPAGYRGLFRLFNLERGLLAGALVTTAGALVLGASLGFAMRGEPFPWGLALGGGLLLSIGLQTVLTSFIFSFLGLSFQRKTISDRA